MVKKRMNKDEPKFYYARVGMYSSLSALLFIIAFLPVLYTFSWIFVENFTLNIFNIKFWLLIISPIPLLVVYLSGWTVFTLIHSKIVCPVFLVPIKTGRYPLKNKNSKLLAIRVSADQTARMMLKP